MTRLNVQGRDVGMSSALSSGKLSSGQAGQMHREVRCQAGEGVAAERTGGNKLEAGH